MFAWLALASRFGKASGAVVMALGASTKGNVLMMTTPVGADLVSKVGDVNPYKYGRFLPGTGIPIVSQEEVLADNPDYLLILPWHFLPKLEKQNQMYMEIAATANLKLVGGTPSLE